MNFAENDRSDSVGPRGPGGWAVRARRAARYLMADAGAVVAFALVLGCLWWFGAL
jgi:hypothetical protein